MRRQYHLKPSTKGFYAWDVDRLVSLSKDLPVTEININTIQELDQTFWYQGEGNVPTCRSIAEHMILVNECDLTFPIILAHDGRIMDGMHRVLKAYINGKKTIKAVQIPYEVKPDFIDIYPDELSY